MNLPVSRRWRGPVGRRSSQRPGGPGSPARPAGAATLPAPDRPGEGRRRPAGDWPGGTRRGPARRLAGLTMAAMAGAVALGGFAATGSGPVAVLAGPDAGRVGGTGPIGAAAAVTGAFPPGGTPLEPGCTVGPVPRSWGLAASYTRGCRAVGLPVVSTGGVADPAIVAAADILHGMLSGRPDLAAAMARRGFRLGILAAGQRAVDLPEYRDLPDEYPWVDWDDARAYGASVLRPLAVVPEENLLCTADDPYAGQSVLTHEIGHSVLDMAVLPADPRFADRLAAAFRHASTLDVYRDTYASTDLDEYWAEGVQDFFDASRPGSGPGGAGDGLDGPVASRETLRAFDPALFSLVAEVFTEADWRPTCPTG